MFDCAVCCERFADVHRVTCPGCAYKMDKICAKKYLFSTSHNADCMSCHIPWGLQVLKKSFGRDWAIGPAGYQAHRQRIFLDREKSKIPETIAMMSELREKQQDKANAKILLAELLAQRVIHDEAIVATRRLATRKITNENATTPRKKFRYICPC